MEGLAGGFYGAKITGGGSGGTVAVAGDGRMFNSLPRVLERYQEMTGIEPQVFYGTSPAALEFGFLEYHFTW